MSMSMSGGDKIIFDDMFLIKSLDPDGKKFDRVRRLFFTSVIRLFQVSRLHCDSESFAMELILDVNTQIYPMDLNQKFRLVVCRCLIPVAIGPSPRFLPQSEMMACQTKESSIKMSVVTLSIQLTSFSRRSTIERIHSST